jgi:hypothetical protein
MPLLVPKALRNINAGRIGNLLRQLSLAPIGRSRLAAQALAELVGNAPFRLPERPFLEASFLWVVVEFPNREKPPQGCLKPVARELLRHSLAVARPAWLVFRTTACRKEPLQKPWQRVSLTL